MKTHHTIYEALKNLERSFVEDYGHLPKFESRVGFEEFMELDENLVTPLLGLESSGCVVATWQKKQHDACVTLRFSDSQTCHYAIISPIHFSIRNGKHFPVYGTSDIKQFLIEWADLTYVLY